MKLRIAMWAAAGALVVVFWSLYTANSTSTGPSGIARVLAYLTCPISLAGHYPLSFYVVLLVNAATYALVGAVVEIIWRHHKRSHFA